MADDSTKAKTGEWTYLAERTQPDLCKKLNELGITDAQFACNGNRITAFFKQPAPKKVAASESKAKSI